MEKKVMTKRDYTEVVRIKSAVQMLGSVIEGLKMGATLGVINTPEDAVDVIIGVYNDQLKALNDMLIEAGIMKDENDSNSLNDILNNTVVIEEVK